MLNAADLPDDIAALKAMLIAATAREARKDERIERLERLVAAFKQAAFGRKSEKTDPDQFDLALEDLETAIAAVQAEDEADAPAGKRVSKPRATNRGSLPSHLPRIEEIDRAGKPGLRLRRMPALHRRGCVRAAGRDPGAVPRHRHPSPQICVPLLHRRRRPGSGPCTADPGGTADGSHRRACAGRQIRRSSSALSAGADHEPPGH